MSKTLSIIIPFKNEREPELAIVLSSINAQFDVDFKAFDIHLVNDGGAPLDLRAFEIFDRLEIHYHEIANGGPGVARQYGIDHSEGAYLMFIDADDVLYYGVALREFFDVLSIEGDKQIFIARFMEQYRGLDGKYWYTTHAQVDWSAVYAKWFNRSYLKEQGLRFRPELRIFEDTYFVGLSCQLATNIRYIDAVVYAWLANPHSVTRDGSGFLNQLHILALENYFYLKVIREKQPQNLSRDYENYLADIYMRYKATPPSDEAAFWQEHLRCVLEFIEIWPDYTEELQAKVDAKRDAENSQWKDVDTAGFRDFLWQSHHE